MNQHFEHMPRLNYHRKYKEQIFEKQGESLRPSFPGPNMIKQIFETIQPPEFLYLVSQSKVDGDRQWQFLREP